MEKDIGKIKRNDNTDIVIRIDDFGGKRGLTIREFVNKSETGYTGFTKSGTRIPADQVQEFKRMMELLDMDDFKEESQASLPVAAEDSSSSEASAKTDESSNSGIDEQGLM
jgi:hypothetical protein